MMIPLWLTRNLGLKVVSILLSIVLWIVVFGSRRIEITKDIPVSVLLSEEMELADPIVERVTFRLLGPKAFLRSIIDREEPPVVIDLRDAKPGNITQQFFAGHIRVPIGVRVVSILPAAVTMRLEPVETKRVPVRLEFAGTPTEGYQLLRADLDLHQVTIRGARSRVERVRELSAMVDLTGIKGVEEHTLQFDLERRGVTIVGSIPKVTIDVQPTSANFRITNVTVRVVSRLRAKLQTDFVTVLVRADPKDLEGIDGKIFAEIDLNDRPKGIYQGSIRVVLPKSIALVSVIPERIQVTLY